MGGGGIGWLSAQPLSPGLSLGVCPRVPACLRLSPLPTTSTCTTTLLAPVLISSSSAPWPPHPLPTSAFLLCCCCCLLGYWLCTVSLSAPSFPPSFSPAQNHRFFPPQQPRCHREASLSLWNRVACSVDGFVREGKARQPGFFRIVAGTQYICRIVGVCQRLHCNSHFGGGYFNEIKVNLRWMGIGESLARTAVW